MDRKWLDIPYANISESEKLDIFLPNEYKQQYPAIMLIHGGGFRFGDKQGIELKLTLKPALEQGFAVVSINYRLSPEAKFPAAPQDVNAAIRFIRANAYSYNIDPYRIALWGTSSGGNLASLAGTTGEYTNFVNYNLNNCRVPWFVSCVVDFYGPINFLTMDSQFVINGLDGQNHNAADSFESLYMGAPIQTIPLTVQKSNPEVYITPNTCPFLIEHGTLDKNIPYQQSVIFAQKLNKKISDSKINLRLIDGAGHGGSLFETKDNLDLVFNFLKTYVC
ncbi:MAG: alpha/beta hydrolase [Clostridiales bacterium]|nr:alpha/beta hydrolase [Clostridiales bacterium]